jgi:hypothetical protein
MAFIIAAEDMPALVVAALPVVDGLSLRAALGEDLALGWVLPRDWELSAGARA